MSHRGSFQGRGRATGRNTGGYGRGRGEDSHQQERGGFGYRHHRGSDIGRGSFRGRDDHRGSSSQVFQQQNVTPDARITKLENEATATNPLDDALKTLSLEQQQQNLPHRPGYGTQGKDVVLFTNYFELALDRSIAMYRYAVSITGGDNEQASSGKKLERVVQLLLKELNVTQPVVTDFRANIITAAELPWKSKEVLVTYSAEGSQPDDHSPRYKVHVSYVAVLSVQDLLDYLTSVVGSTDPFDLNLKPSVLQALNIIIAHGMKASDNVLSTSNKHFPLQGANAERFPLGPGLEAIRGYFLSARPSTGRILINAQIKHLAIYKPGRLDQVLGFMGWQPNADQAVLRRTNKYLKGVSVKVMHFSSPRSKTVFGLASVRDGKDSDNHRPRVQCDGALSTQVKFWSADQGYVTVADYFNENYGKRSQFPVVNIGNARKPTYCLAELCVVADGTPYRHRLSPAQSQMMIKTAVRFPSQNATTVAQTGSSTIREYSGQTLDGFGLKFDSSLVPVHGRVLETPSLQYEKRGNGPRTIETKLGMWTPHVAQLEFSRGATLHDWHFIWIRSRDVDERGFRRLEEVGASIEQLQRALRANGIRVQKAPVGHELVINDAETCEDAINQKIGHLSKLRNRPMLVVVVLPSDESGIYNAVKRAGDISWGLHTVCIKPPEARPAQGPYFGNVAMKVNLKLGGTNQRMPDAGGSGGNKLDLISLAANTMIVGLDVTHPATGESKAPSIAAIVASTDRTLGQWPADVRIQRESRREMIDALKDMVKGRLRLWQRRNGGSFPDQILVYRDGVSEGQYDLVRTAELPLIRDACSELYTADQTRAGVPRVSVVVVGKRHHTRFYPTGPTGGKNGNVANGTVVDRGITESRVWDFFLVAHTALQGTARPAHYIVVHDEIFRHGLGPKSAAADTLETLTHDLCYLFGRATKAVSLCPPAYYADIACERARRWLSRVFVDDDSNSSNAGSVEVRDEEVRVHPSLAESMFYI